MNYKRLLIIKFILLFTITSPILKGQQKNIKPNIVYILADDLGWADVGYHGGEIKTPNIDRLATNGIKLEQFYVQPACTPTRAALLTGRSPMRYGLQVSVLWAHEKRGLPLTEKILPQALKTEGYKTAMVGKWHLGHHEPAYLPENRGFDHQYGHYTGNLDYFKHTHQGVHDWHRNGKAVYEEGYATDLMAEEAVRIISDSAKDKPLFLYLAFNAPHTPLQATPEYLEQYTHIKDERRRTFAAMVTNMDDAIGKVVAALEKEGILDNTLIVFSSDNGGPMDHGADNGKFRNDKGTLYEGGVRVPALVYWRDRLKPGVCYEMLNVTDWYPTLLNLAGASLKQPLSVDGKDIWQTIADSKPSPHDEMLIRIEPVRGALRQKNWKLVINGDLDMHWDNVQMILNNSMDWGEIAKKSTNAPTLFTTCIELFNIAKDPFERNNLANQYPAKTKELILKLYEFSLQAEHPTNEGIRSPPGFVNPKIWGEAQ